ncbi:MAG: NAD nucleotidase [Thiothrix lacustris]|uniref:NAD nucleotidase n=1 Tax=Thiothrix lacustris TaxID=525917 RepID=A0A1Y1QF27_9GAMM|nr:MAG: NAD nucleotidase [Thiothrix lacustris]
MKLKRSLLASACIAALGLMSGCNNNNTVAAVSTDAPATSLRILHINDHHSHLQPNSASLNLAGATTAVKTGGFPRVVSKINELAAQGGNVLKLHAGDATTGDLYFTLFKGKADAEQMNQVCFDAFTLGNHEFDQGDAGLKTFLDYLNSSACKTDVLSANVFPKVGTSPLTPTSATDYLKPYTIKTVNGQKFGIIGLTIAGKTKNSSSPDATTTFADEATTAQQYIDELNVLGVNKIILLTHQGYANDQVIAKQLNGVDVIVGGDSHTLLGDGFKAYGLSPSGAYPTKTTDANGKQVCIAQASQYSDIVGELTIEFSANGEVTACSGIPHLLLSDTFQRNKVELTGAERDAVLKAVADAPELSIVTSDAAAQANLDGYSQQVDVMKQTVIGAAAETLCHERIPNQGLSKTAGCTAATQSHGSDIANTVSKAFLEMSLTSDICLQNGGGVRVDVPAGAITLGTAYTLLPFANTLTEMTMTGQDIISSLEDGIDFALNPQGSTGSYPYAAGLRWDADLSQAKGARVTHVEVNPRVTGAWVAIDPAKTYKVVTNSFLATGGDGYTTFKNLASDKKLNTYLDYAQSFADYVSRETAAGRSVMKLPVEEYSTQQFIDKDGVLQ